ncbi:zinc finger protein 567-like [Entelurus aequoreus]|uniref:zinc finger protein 567-like n=1 Tax=Entelurus aequoreus TaxID=161455 RepID=UPI002B1D602D|nr:zinc finger protein 567-like [Entelurus aequoreus]
MWERTTAEYKEELSGTKLLDAVAKKHQVVSHRTDVQQTPHIKEEEEEVWITQVGECLPGQEEADLTKFPLTVVSVKTEDHEDKPPESSQRHHSPNAWEEHLLPEQQGRRFRMEQEGPQPSRIKEEDEAPQSLHIKEEKESPLTSHVKEEDEAPQPPHIKDEEEEHSISQEFPVIVVTQLVVEQLEGLEEVDVTKMPVTGVTVKSEDDDEHLPEQQKWSFRMATEEPHPSHIKEEDAELQTLHIKKEEEEDSISQEGEHLEWLEEFPVTGVPVKSEGDEVKGESEEKREAEPPSSSSTQHMTTEADGDHCGGSQADKLLAPLSDSQDTTSHSPDTDDEHSKDDKTCHTDNTHFTCSHCDKTFRFRSELIAHMRKHTGERPFECSVCSRRFSTKSTMKLHKSVHSGEKPFICSVCSKGFRLRQEWKIHTKIHTREKVFSCSACGERFFTKCKRHKCAGKKSRSRGGNVARILPRPCQPTQGCWFVTSFRHPSHGCSVLLPSAPTLYATAGPLMLSVSGVNSSSCR